jgi:hypothetical protein
LLIAGPVFAGLTLLGRIRSLGGGSIDPTDPDNFNF